MKDLVLGHPEAWIPALGAVLMLVLQPGENASVRRFAIWKLARSVTIDAVLFGEAIRELISGKAQEPAVIEVVHAAPEDEVSK